MNPGRLNNVYELLAENNFERNENVPNKLKCLKCGKILINACQGPCGCRYCRVCLDALLNSGCQNCPGKEEYCEETNLSIFQIDFSTNTEISKLVVKCPFEMCTFESELININEHLRLCPNKCFRCVFHDLGCHGENVSVTNMNEHLQSENQRHMTMLMGIIDNFRNEMNRLKENDVRKGHEIDNLKLDLIIKAEKIELLEEEIKSMKEQKNDNLRTEIVKTNAKMDTGPREMQQEFTKALDKYQMGVNKRMNEADKWLDKLMDGTFLWVIDKIDERRKNREIVNSGYFHGKMQPYKMSLLMCVNGDPDHIGIGLNIGLFIHDDAINDIVKWPFTADVTIKILNKSVPNKRKTMTKHCIIDKPEINSCKNSDPFNFSYSDLSRASLLVGDCLIVECSIDLPYIDVFRQ